MLKRMLIMLGIVGLFFGGVFGYQAFGKHMMNRYFATMKDPPVVVSTVRASLEAWQPRIRAVGSLRAVRGVELANEVPGIIEGVFFKSGDEVKEGQVLVELNRDSDIAQRQALEAAVELAQTVYDRDKKQLEIQAVSQAVVDADAAELKSRKAQLSQQQAMLDKRTIRAPFAGRLGIATVNPGQYLDPGQKIVTLQALDQVYIDFFLPQQELARIAVGQRVEVSVDAFPERVFSAGITAISPKVEADSRNLKVEAVLANPKHELLPGMFVSVEVEAGASRKHLTLPQTALTFNPYGETVFVVEQDGKDEKGAPVLKARQRFVTVGETRGDQVAVLSGLKESETVVSSGQHKLKNGSVVVVNNEVQAANDPDPRPVEQ